MTDKNTYKASGKDQLIGLGFFLGAITLAFIIGPRLATHSFKKAPKEATS